jgi:hypothetical protein
MERAVPARSSLEPARPRFARRRNKSGLRERADQILRQDGASPSKPDRALVATRATTRPRDGRGDRGSGTPGVSGRAAVSVNAVAGAVAGTLVSLVLHPVDTVKVAIQADRRARRSVGAVVATMLKQRGPFGLYSGLSASLASAAPISALYTASYEAAKLKLAPLFSEDRQWVAHCAAGAAASVATSFVYTPSECVKQRCQVSGNVKAWQAARMIVRESGVGGLYKGWTAVLCRNIPQSAIKFFVFEKLMRAVYASAAGRGAGTLPSLAVGGIAGSTAAMFTTPFDTVKTRLQTVGIAGVDKGGGHARRRGDGARHHRRRGRRRLISRSAPAPVHLRHAGCRVLLVVRVHAQVPAAVRLGARRLGGGGGRAVIRARSFTFVVYLL